MFGGINNTARALRYVAERLFARIIDDKEYLRELSDERKEERQKKRLAAQLKRKQAAAKKKARETQEKARRKRGLPAKPVVTTGSLCFGAPVQLSTTNFFQSSSFNQYFKKIEDEEFAASTVKAGSKNQKLLENNFIYLTLDEAKAKCQKTANDVLGGKATGIIQRTVKKKRANRILSKKIDETQYLVYTGDPKLVNTVTPNTKAAEFASTNPKFIPANPCVSASKKPAKQIPEDRNIFSVQRMFRRAFGVTGQILNIFIFVALGIFGASLATNLNVYRDWPYRVLYLIYGFVFFFIVIPYVLLWRWAYLKQRPRFYSLFPIIGMHFDHPMTAAMFSWLSFKPDADMELLDGCRKD
jgi:hypothetical protein